MKTTPQNPSPPPHLIGEKVFEHGYEYGIGWFLSETSPTPPIWQEIVDFIRDNFLEPHTEGCLSGSQLIDNAGFLIGWIYGAFTAI